MNDGSGYVVANSGVSGTQYNGLLTTAAYGGLAAAEPQYNTAGATLTVGGSHYAPPVWNTSGAAAGPFGCSLGFSGYQPDAWNGTGVLTNWGMNFVSVPAGAASTQGCGLGGGAGSTANLTISMWVDWGTNPQYANVHLAPAGSSTPNNASAMDVWSYGQPLGWNGNASFSDLECGLAGSGATTTVDGSTVKLGLTTTNAQSSAGQGTTTMNGTPTTGWNNVVITASSNTWNEYLNGVLLSSASGVALGIGSTGSATGSPSSQQNPLTLGGCFAYGESSTATNPWKAQCISPSTLTTGTLVGYVGPFNGNMSDVRYFPSRAQRRRGGGDLQYAPGLRVGQL